MVFKGTYCLCIKCKTEQSIRIGSLGILKFNSGDYIYIGSALKSLQPRLVRHIRVSKGKHPITHWHIDYFLKELSVSIEEIYVLEDGEKMECILATKVSKYGAPVKGFGCSDCRCNSHLYKVKDYKFLEKMGMRRYSIDSLKISE